MNNISDINLHLPNIVICLDKFIKIILKLTKYKLIQNNLLYNLSQILENELNDKKQ